MKVTEEEFFHIHRKNHHQDLWQQGNTLETPKEEFNHFYKSISTEPHHKISVNLQQFDLIAYLNNHLAELEKFNTEVEDQELTENNISNIKGFNSHILYLLNETFQSLAQSRKIIREMIFEERRLKTFSDLPSRKRCFWLSDKKELEKWWSEFNDCENKKIYKVSVTGNLFSADASFIQMDVFKFTDFFDLANKYWQGDLNAATDLIRKEIIFEGKIKILTEHNNPSEI